MRPIFWAALAGALAALPRGARGAYTRDPVLMWSSRPLSEAVLTRVGEWEPVLDTALTFALPNEASVLFSYTASLLALHADGAGSAKRGADAISAGTASFGGGGASRFSVAQLRLVVDGAPHRASAAHVSAAAGGGARAAALADGAEGHLALALAAGNHTVRLEWKASGSPSVQWRSAPQLADGFAASRSLVATARHRYLYASASEATARLTATGGWEPLPGSTLSFELAERATLRLSYSLGVRTDGDLGQRAARGGASSRDDVSSRLVVDGAPLRETGCLLYTSPSPRD